MLDSSRIHGISMALSTASNLSPCHPQVNHIHGSFMALSHGTFSQCHEHDSLEGDNFEVVESAIKIV